MCTVLYVYWVLFRNESVLILIYVVFSTETSTDGGNDDVNNGMSNGTCTLLYIMLVSFWNGSVLMLIYVVSAEASIDGTDDINTGVSNRMCTLLYIIYLVLFWIHSVLIPTSWLHVAFDGAGSGGTDAGSHEDGANKGSDGDGRGGPSPGMLLVVFGFGIILDSFCSHTIIS